MADLHSQQRKPWELDALTRLRRSGPLGMQAVDFIAQRNVRLGFAAQPTGAKWTLRGMLVGPPLIQISDKQQKSVETGRDAWSISLIAHEAWHYHQGLLTALSVYGELEAWQLQMKVLRGLEAPPTHPALNAIEHLSLNHDPETLREAVRLMKAYSPAYRIDLLPLNPLLYMAVAGWARALRSVGRKFTKRS